MSVVGHAVLYAAFAVVAAWLVGELLLQHRAAPHWRGLALLGFLGLVGGVALGSLPLIGVGVVAFGVGQYLVTSSVRTGGGPHWSLRAADGSLPGALGRLPLLGTVFPAGEAESGVVPPPPELVGEVGPVEPLEAAPPAFAYEPEPQPAYTYDYVATEYSTEYSPEYGSPGHQYDYSRQQAQYTGYEQQPVQYDYGWQDQPQEPQPQQYAYYEPQQQYYYPPEQPQDYVYRPEPMDEEPEPRQYG